MRKDLYSTPLTLDELRKMGGQPVYIADYGDWAIVAIEQESRNSLPKPYLCGAHYDENHNLSVNFYYDFETRGLTVYRCPIKFESGLKPCFIQGAI